MEKKISASAVEADSEVRQALKDFVSSITSSKEEAHELELDTLWLASRHASLKPQHVNFKSWLMAIACNVQLYTIRRGRKVTTAARTAHASNGIN